MHQNRTRHYTTLALITIAPFAGLAGSALADDAPAAAAAEPKKKPTWETTAAAGLTLTRGNSDTLLTTLSLDTARKWTSDEFFAGASGGYGENDGERNTQFAKAYAQYNHLFSERLYAGFRLDANYDAIADLDYRFTLSPLVGYYFIKTPRTSLSLEAGPSAVLEKYRGADSDTYLGARFAEKFEHKISDTTKIWESLQYVPKVTHWADKYVLTGEAGIDTAITKQWSLRVVVQDVYDSEPVAGSKKNNLQLIAGTAYKF